MEEHAVQQAEDQSPDQREYHPRFLEFIKHLEGINTTEKLFPKTCRTCGKVFPSFGNYLVDTIPKAHSFEDCAEVMGSPFTMIYRHCACGNTLVLTLTLENFPRLDELWAMLHEEAELQGEPLQKVIAAFAEQCRWYFLSSRDEAEGAGAEAEATRPDASGS
jgi:hypothetical protein